MKQVFSVLSIASVALLTIFLSATSTGCKKGDDGAKGDTGTANVMFSKWQDVTFTPAKNSAGDTVAWTATMNAPKLTQSILDSGVVKVYLNAGTEADPAVFALPFTDYYALTGIENLNVYFSVGMINMYATGDAGTGLSSNGQKAFQFRYVLIPGGVSTGRSATVDLNNYQAVKSFYNITD